MLISLALVFLVGLSMAALCQRLNLPRIIGMLLTGILLSVAVLAILITAPLGAIGMDRTYQKLLVREEILGEKR